MTQRLVEDLIVHARRGDLSPEEEKSLRTLLDSSRTARLWFEAGLGFDAESPVLPGDEELLTRLNARVAGATARRSPRAWWRIALPAATATLVATSAAAGGWVLWQHSSADATHAPRESPSATSGTPRSRPVPARPHQEVLAPVASHVAETVAPRPPATLVAPAPSRQSEGVSELFERANRARREGRTREAMALYQRLSSLAPGSAQAEQAELALGELNLQKGTAEAALQHFRSYRGQTLSAEALWGEARALHELGRVGEERRALATLCRRFPGSPYAESARKRLGALTE